MPIATELTIDTGADALTLAQTIFGNGVSVTSATLTGAAGASATYSGADVTLGGIAPGDSGIILSTGQAADFTNSDNSTNTNTAEGGASTDNLTAGDAQLDALTGQTTQDAIVLETTFTTTGDYITMLFTFSSEEYLEYVNSGVNDAFGVWVNGIYTPLTPIPSEIVSIDTVNSTNAGNLYLDNPIASDTYNTEMDGTTQVLSIKAPVSSTVTNTIRIALADGGDGLYDTNVLIAANSVQSVALAFDDQVTLEANTATTVDILSNDIDTNGAGLSITEINGTAVVVGQTVILPTGEQITLNADNTLTILSDNDQGSEPFTYKVVDGAGNTDVGYVTINTVADLPLNFIVEGTSGNDTINAGYTLDPQGDRIDAGDAADGSNNDSIQAGAGNDVINAETGNDTVDAGTGNDSVLAGLGNDSVIAGDGNDTVFGQAGDDTLLGGEGADSLDGDDGSDSLDGGGGNDTLIGDAGNDTLLGGVGNDEIYVSTGNNYIDGGANNDLIFGGDLADTIFGGTELDTISGGSGADYIDGGADADSLMGGIGDDTLLGGTGADTISGGDGNDSIDGGDDNDIVNGFDGNDTVSGGAGDDSVYGGAGDDSLLGGTGNDSMEGWFGNDTLEGGDGDDYMDAGEGDDLLVGGDGNDTLLAGSGVGQDTLIGGAGNDVLSSGDGDDILSGGIGDDTYFGAGGDDLIILEDGFGNDQISGGETGETKGDTLDLSAVTGPLTIDLTASNAEAGTVSDGVGTATFQEIENIVLGGGVDTLVLANGSGDDTVAGFSAPTVDGGGVWTGVDQLDVSDLTDLNGAPVNTGDVTITDTIGDGSGDAILTFPGGESITLIGVLPSLFSNPLALEAIGIPMPNYIVEGTGGDDLIDAGYLGDPEGDLVDASDNATGTNADSIVTGGGNDTILAGLDNDTVDAGTGNDSVDGGTGDDSILGGDGNDTLFGGSGSDTLLGGAGDDSLFAGTSTAAGDLLVGGAGNDTLYDSTGTATLDGGDDADVFELGTGDATVFGGDGGTNYDTISFMLGGVASDAVTITITPTGPEQGVFTDLDGDAGEFTGIEAFELTNFNDSFNGAAATQSMTISGALGDDTLSGGLAADSISGGVGADWLYGNGGADSILGGADNDLLYGGDGADTLLGETGDDYLQGDAGADSLIGGDGNDNLDGGDDNDTLLGGTGNDNMTGGAGADSMLGGVGNDSMWGGTGNDTLDGGDGNDAIYAGAGDDVVLAGAGTDYIQLESGNDTVLAGDDNDNINVISGAYADGSGVTIDGGTGGLDSDTLNLGSWTYFRNLVETADPDGDSTSGSVELEDASGNVITVTFSEIETLVLPPPAPNYIVEGTVGNDSIGFAYLGDPEGDRIDNNDALDGSNDDSVVAGAGDDTISSGAGNDTVFGDEGNDYIIAGAGDDLVFGGTGNDVVFGFDGSDTVLGGDGDDIINGMTGADLLDGGADGDRFVIEAAFGADTLIGGEAVTTGVDFDTIAINTVAVVDPVTVIFDGEEQGSLSVGSDTLTFFEIERIELGNANDIVDGTATTGGINIDAGDGDDSVTGGSGADTIVGGSGNDTIGAGQGADQITAGAGDDLIEVAQGDSVTGGDGDDTFILFDLGEAGTDAINIVGGEGGEILGDTLDLNGQADRTTLNITTPAGVAGGQSGSVELLDGTLVNFSNIENIVCFVPGTLIATQAGLRKIEDLRVGDPVMTQDNGIQRVGWVGRTTVCAMDRFAPVHFDKSLWPGALAGLTVSPQHRMLVKGYQSELLFGQSEVLVSAVHMLDGDLVVRQPQKHVTYIHIMFQQHEIIFANGIPTESFHPGGYGVDKLAMEAREELFALFPELRSNLNGYGDTARMALKAREAKVLSDFTATQAGRAAVPVLSSAGRGC